MDSEFSTKNNSDAPSDHYELGLMTAMLAHEIRNPIQSIRFQIDASKHGAPMLTTLDKIQNSLNRLESVANRVQQLGTKVVVQCSAVNLRELTDRTVDSLHVWFEAARITLKTHFDWEGEASVFADGDLVEQVLINLLMNAVQAMPQGGELTLEVREEVDHALIEIRDTGVGITAEDLLKVGTPFFTTKEKGSGLGLSFCKTIAHLHGGSLLIESEKGKGTTVSFRFRKTEKNTHEGEGEDFNHDQS